MTDASAAVIPIEPAAAPPVDGLSNRAVADVIGVSKSAVHRAGVPNGTADDENANEANGAEDETVPNGTPADPVVEEPPREIMPPAPAAATVRAEPALPTEAMPSQSAAPSADAPALPEIEYPIGSTRQAILDHFLDSDSPEQSMAQIKAGLSTVLPGTVEAAVRREWEQGRLQRVSPGVYRLAPPKPVVPPKLAPPPEPVRDDGISDEQWLAWLGDWRATGKWDAPGNPPGHPGCAVPAGVIAKHNDAARKRAERQRDRKAAQARQSAADQELRDRLITATGGNIVRGPGLDDVSPIRAALELVPIDRILSSVRNKTDRRMYPANEPATSWREQRLLLEIAESYCRTDIVPNLVAAWASAGKTPAPKTQSSPMAAPMADVDELRRHHDDEHAPPGPHSLPGAAPSAPDRRRSP